MERPELLYRKTKIVSTIGPAVSPEKRLRALLRAGVDVCRLNFSHGDHRSHQAIHDRIRMVEAEVGRPVAILQDLCGPKIRTSKVPDGMILEAGDVIELVANLPLAEGRRIGISLDRLADDAEPGQRIMIDDGLLELTVEGVRPEDKTIECRVLHGGLLKSRKGVNLPDTRLQLASFTEKDRKDLEFGVKNEVDYVALSFVRHEDDVLPIRERIASMRNPPRVIAKIERPEAVERLVPIVQAFDGVMVARGDLSVEVPLYAVPEIQKQIIRAAIKYDRPVITATQMLDSMQENPRPTRAEASDVANAIYDGTDAVMLSGETATGRFPIEAVKVMGEIARSADRASVNDTIHSRQETDVDMSTFCDAICAGALRVAEATRAKVLVTFTQTGRTALLMSKYFPGIPIMGVTSMLTTLRRMCLYRGVEPVLLQDTERSEALVQAAEEAIINRGFGRPGDIVIYVGGANLTAAGNINSLKVRRIGTDVSEVDVIL